MMENNSINSPIIEEKGLLKEIFGKDDEEIAWERLQKERATAFADSGLTADCLLIDRMHDLVKLRVNKGWRFYQFSEIQSYGPLIQILHDAQPAHFSLHTTLGKTEDVLISAGFPSRSEILETYSTAKRMLDTIISETKKGIK